MTLGVPEMMKHPLYVYVQGVAISKKTDNCHVWQKSKGRSDLFGSDFLVRFRLLRHSSRARYLVHTCENAVLFQIAHGLEALAGGFSQLAV